MRKRKKRNNKSENILGHPNYAEALEMAGRARRGSITPLDKIPTDLGTGSHTQYKLQAVITIMDGIGKLPGDIPKEQFDRPITYHKLQPEAVEWLEKARIPARRVTPFATLAYRDWFAREQNYLISEKIIEKFFSHFTHCLLVETQIIIARQYYYGLGLYQPQNPSLSEILSELPFQQIPAEYRAELQEAYDAGTDLSTIQLDQLHGRIFLEYCVMMIRAQWDKLVSLACLVFGRRQGWASIFDGLRDLDQHISSKAEFDRCKPYFEIFQEIADERLGEGAWLKNFRDSLIHAVGQHSSGVAPHRTSKLTTSELWDKMCEEHNWLREAMMVLLIVIAWRYQKRQSDENPD
jgi:hypothetical protein